MITTLCMTVAWAHRPEALTDRIRVSDPEISWSLVGQFETGLEAFVVELPFANDFATPFEILVPHKGQYELHRPNYAIVGPGLPEPSDELRAILPFDVPEGMGVFHEANNDVQRDSFFEGVLRRNLWTSGRVAIPLMAGDHEVWIWSPNVTTGPFWFAFGVEEDFSDASVFDTFRNWGLYAWK